jgi:S-DNA-T family DNA segregation ATPase FtsK/SpoIIIE
MSLKGNQFKSNSFKQEESAKAGQKQTISREPKPKADLMPTFDLQNGRLFKIIGLFLLFSRFIS